MPLSQITRPDVEAAIAEFADGDRTSLLQDYGFGVSTAWLVRESGRFYDPKALVGVAHKYATGTALSPNDFNTDMTRALLKELGFDLVRFTGLWWVNQGSAYAAERDGGYLWAGQKSSDGRNLPHHSNVMNLKPGQTIIHYANSEIVAIGTVADNPRRADRADFADPHSASDVGYLCAVDYRELTAPISEFPDSLTTAKPFAADRRARQGYLFRIEDSKTLDVLAFLNERIPDLFEAEPTHPSAGRGVRASTSAESSVDLPILETLLTFKNIVLEGVPGTGKTYAIEQIADSWLRRTGRPLHLFDQLPYRAIVMHPSTSYEDFIEGLRPVSQSAPGSFAYFDQRPASESQFGIADGFFVELCQAAVQSPDEDVLVLLDEFNRCNIPSVFGDLLLTLEETRRAHYTGAPAHATATARDWTVKVPARLQYSGRTFFVPDNVYIIATTNTTDRSVAPLDAALRRRFAFYRLEPEMPRSLQLEGVDESTVDLFTRGAAVIEALNELVLRPCLGPDALLGHSYFYAMAASIKSRAGANATSMVASHWRYTILTQLIDSVRAHNAEDLLDTRARSAWFDNHSELTSQADDSIQQALAELDAFLADSLGLAINVEGTGLTRAARVVVHTAPAIEEVGGADGESPEDQQVS